MGVQAALRHDGVALSIEIEVSPGASADEFPFGFNPWRKRIGARVKARAREGEANDAVVRLVARFFRVPTRAVSIGLGSLDSRKTVRVEGVTLEEARARLEESGGA